MYAKYACKKSMQKYEFVNKIGMQKNIQKYAKVSKLCKSMDMYTK